MRHFRSFAGESAEQKGYWAEMGDVIEPSRRYDCCHYSSCLSKAARINADDMGCSSCKRFRSAPEIMKINLSAHIKLLVAIFLPQVYQKMSKHKIADGAFWKVMFSEKEDTNL